MKTPHFTEVMKLEEYMKYTVYRRYNNFSDFRMELIEFLNSNFRGRQDNFNINKAIGREFTGFVWSELQDQWKGIVFNKGLFKHTMVSIFNNQALVVRGYPEVEGKIEEISNDVKKVYYVPKYDGVLLSTYNMPNGVFSGKTKEIEYIDRNGGMNINFLKILRDLDVKEKLQALSEEYDCVVHGMIRGKELSGDSSGEYSYIALDICDRNNHSFYDKEIANRIFESYGLEIEQHFDKDKIEEMLVEYNGVIAKVYSQGELSIYKQELEVDEQIRCRRAVRDAHAAACDFCWTNPNYDGRLEIILLQHDLIDSKNLTWLKSEIHKPASNPERVEKIKGYLDMHYNNIKDLNAEEVYDKLKWKWEWSALDDKAIVIPIIEEWILEAKDEVKIEELKFKKHSDSIYFK